MKEPATAFLWVGKESNSLFMQGFRETRHHFPVPGTGCIHADLLVLLFGEETTPSIQAAPASLYKLSDAWLFCKYSQTKRFCTTSPGPVFSGPWINSIKSSLLLPTTSPRHTHLCLPCHPLAHVPVQPIVCPLATCAHRCLYYMHVLSLMLDMA